jgi:hypothetical protein
MAEVWPSRKGRHDVSLTSLRPALQADKEIVTIRRLKAEVDYVLPADPEAPSHAWRQHKSSGSEAVQSISVIPFDREATTFYVSLIAIGP